jgi:hypothetical protein
MSDHFMPCFHLGGVWRDANSISMVDFEMPLDVESLEQGAAWIAYGIGERFRPRHPTPWLADGRAWRDRLPWARRMEEYKVRPMCSVEKDWFRLAAKKLRSLADSASESDLVWLSFNGETLRIAEAVAALDEVAETRPRQVIDERAHALRDQHVHGLETSLDAKSATGRLFYVGLTHGSVSHSRTPASRSSGGFMIPSTPSSCPPMGS